ncbi:NUDIX hydrolase [Dysgonomonas sp. GY75]|uniref:NUDIX hydrolase n=2 Tax=Dysgonomonas TaxID=156973 RepID=UPI0018844F42|nr:NUDIX domain-containing protein [Dysgonomonas sp. GY75]MBF0649308.1 NUDIX hydrolase [Dysgonomonas sp. GY75]
MEKEKPPFETLDQGSGIFIPNVSVDCIILGFDSGRLKVLLCKFKVSEKWMLPGGFVAKDEDPDESALRVLKGRTGLEDVYLRQFYFFGKKGRIGVEENADMLKRFNIREDKGQWYTDRFISLGYYSLIKYNEAQLFTNEEYEEAGWFDINEIPSLYADHKEIIDTAMSTIRRQIGFIPMGYELLPEKFTMPELRCIYEAILGREIDRRNFQRKMLSIGYIQPLNETRKAGAHKSPNLYTFIKEKYEEAEKYGIQVMSNNF